MRTKVSKSTKQNTAKTKTKIKLQKKKKTFQCDPEILVCFILYYFCLFSLFKFVAAMAVCLKYTHETKVAKEKKNWFFFGTFIYYFIWC